MRTKDLWVLSIIFVGLAIFNPVTGQGNKYKRRAGGNKNVSRYTGQSAGKFRSYDYLGVGINALNYYGDLAPLSRAASTDVSFTRPGIGITYGKRAFPQVSIRLNYNFGRIKGDDVSSRVEGEDSELSPRYVRNLSFRNNIHEMNVGLNIYFLPDGNAPSFRSPFNIYLFLGAGFFLHDPKGKVPDYDYQLYGPDAASQGVDKLPNAGEWIKLRTLNTEGQGKDYGELETPEIYKPFQWNIPVNLGAMMTIPRTPFNVHLELGYRFLFTDYLDDVSNKYINLSRFDNDLARIMSDRSAEPTNGFGSVNRNLDAINIAQQNINGTSYYVAIDNGSGQDGSIRGNPKNNDVYFVTQIKLTYIIPPTGLSKGSRKSSAKFR